MLYNYSNLLGVILLLLQSPLTNNKLINLSMVQENYLAFYFKENMFISMKYQKKLFDEKLLNDVMPPLLLI